MIFSPVGRTVTVANMSVSLSLTFANSSKPSDDNIEQPLLCPLPWPLYELVTWGTTEILDQLLASLGAFSAFVMTPSPHTLQNTHCVLENQRDGYVFVSMLEWQPSENTEKHKSLPGETSASIITLGSLWSDGFNNFKRIYDTVRMLSSKTKGFTPVGDKFSVCVRGGGQCEFSSRIRGGGPESALSVQGIALSPGNIFSRRTELPAGTICSGTQGASSVEQVAGIWVGMQCMMHPAHDTPHGLV